MAVLLNEIVKRMTNPAAKGVMTNLLRYSDLAATLPFKDVEALKITASRWSTSPSAGFRQVNGGYTESTGTTEDIAETLALLGGDVKIDKVAEKVQARSEKVLVTQMKMKTKAVAFTFNDTFINGDQGSDPDAFEGIKKRVSNMPARMTISLSPGASDSLKVLASAANEKTFIEALHAAIKYVDGANRIYANENTIVKFGSVLRDLGLVYDVVNIYDRNFDSFNKVPFIDVGLKSDKSTEIITSTEDPGDGGNDSTSIYVARVDSDEGLMGIQLKGMGMQVYDPLGGKEMEAGPQYLRRIDWAVGLQNLSNYCICRIKDFKMAAS